MMVKALTEPRQRLLLGTSVGIRLSLLLLLVLLITITVIVVAAVVSVLAVLVSALLLVVRRSTKSQRSRISDRNVAHN